MNFDMLVKGRLWNLYKSLPLFSLGKEKRAVSSVVYLPSVFSFLTSTTPAGINKIVKFCWCLQLEAVVGGGGILQEEVGFGVTVLRAVGTFLVAGDMAGMNSKTRVSFQGGLGVQLDMLERIISKVIRVEAEGEGVKVGQKAVHFLHEHREGKLTDDFFDSTNEGHDDNRFCFGFIF